MNLIRHWIRNFPEPQKAAITEALESASLAKIRRALRLLEEIDPEERGPIFGVEFVSTFNLEPVLPVLQLALDFGGWWSFFPKLSILFRGAFRNNSHLAPMKWW